MLVPVRSTVIIVDGNGSTWGRMDYQVREWEIPSPLLKKAGNWDSEVDDYQTPVIVMAMRCGCVEIGCAAGHQGRKPGTAIAS